MSLTVREIEQVGDVLTRILDERFGIGVGPPTTRALVGEAYPFREKADRYMELHAIIEVGPILQALLDSPWPTRLLYLPREYDRDVDDLELLYHNADLVDADPHAMQRLASLVGYPILRMQELDGMTNPDVMVIAPINRRVARHGAAVTGQYARDKARSWAFGMVSTANNQDKLNAALARAAEQGALT